MVLGAIVSFVVALLIGGLGIYIGAFVVADVEDYTHAVVTAFIGAVAWGLVSWIPLIGGLIALVVWIGVINWRYSGGWMDAVSIGLVAWVATIIVTWLLGAFLNLGIGAFGVPGA
ncbi:MAG: hypothetical protein ABEJ60_08500 [Halodesulfurarchaeum sp.]